MVTPDREYDVHCTSVGYILCMTDPVSSATGKYVFVKLQATRHYKLQCQLMLYTSWLSWRSRGIYIKSRSKLTPTQPNHPQTPDNVPPTPQDAYSPFHVPAAHLYPATDGNHQIALHKFSPRHSEYISQRNSWK